MKYRHNKHMMRHMRGDNSHDGRRSGKGRKMVARGNRRGHRVLKHGDLKFLLLAMIEKDPSHGYDLIQAIEKKTQGRYKPSPGVAYPALELLRDMGWVRAEDSTDKKIFVITSEGKATLEREADRLAEIDDRLEKVSTADDPAGRHAAKREIGLLGYTLKSTLRSFRQSETPPPIGEITAILKEAREKIETLTAKLPKS